MDGLRRDPIGYVHTTTQRGELNIRRALTIIHHSDQGSQYTSIASATVIRSPACVLQWKVSKTAMTTRITASRQKCENFFATLEYELLDRPRTENRAEATRLVFQFIEA